MIDIFKLTDFGDQSIIIGSRADMLYKNLGLKYVRKDWINNIGLDKEYLKQFEKPYGFDEQAFLQKFGLRAVQFGNWMGYSDRADHFVALVQALEHLSRILGTKNLGYSGKLSVAIGARGRSKALAHFEPLSNIINLTKEKGGHSFAHEYGHAIDYMSGEYFSKNPRIYSLSYAAATETNLQNGKIDEVRNLMNIILDGVRSGERYPALVEWSKSKKSFDYWCNNTEIFARTFAQWIALQCNQMGINDNVLSVGIDNKNISNITVNELKQISPYISKLVKLNSRFLNTGQKPPKVTTKNPFIGKIYKIETKKDKKKAAAVKNKTIKQNKHYEHF